MQELPKCLLAHARGACDAYARTVDVRTAAPASAATCCVIFDDTPRRILFSGVDEES